MTFSYAVEKPNIRRKDDGRPNRPQRVERSGGDKRPDTGSFPIIRFTLATLILIIWAIAYTRAVFDPSFTPPAGLSAPALMAVAYLLGSGVLQNRDRDKRND